MERPPEPIPMPSRAPVPPLVRTGEVWGRELALWVRAVEEWREKARRQLHAAERYWDEIQQPEGRHRHVWSLMAAAGAAGFVVGVLWRRRTSATH